MTIHKEGRKILFYLLLILVVINLVLISLYPAATWIQNLLILGSLMLYGFVLQFFRCPTIKINANENQILAPADGKVVVVEESDETEYFKDTRIQVSIFMSPINAHNNRCPVEGTVKYFKYHRGKYLVAWHPKSSTLNERTSMVVSMKSGIEILVRQIAGIMARRIKYYVNEGDHLGHGEEFGFIRFGSRLDVFMPLNTRVLVNIGDKTKAGKTVIAEFRE